MTEHAAETEETSTVVRVEDLDRQFGSVSVLEGVEFTAEAGTVTALIGPNGSGKTTLLQVVTGLLAPTDGSVTVAGTGERPVGYLPQDPAFRPSFTVRETLAFYGDLLAPAVDVAAAVDRVGLSAVADRRVDALSGGMLRLLGIAQAVLGDPSLVVLDEPTGDLDPRMTDYIFDVATDLADEGRAVLLATHNLVGAERADQVLLLDGGRVAYDGTPAEVTAELDAESLAAAFLAAVGAEGPTVRAGRDG
ncbi:MAG: ABC transporter ATP-binding protein [Haloarculaceae archaeon]